MLSIKAICDTIAQQTIECLCLQNIAKLDINLHKIIAKQIRKIDNLLNTKNTKNLSQLRV